MGSFCDDIVTAVEPANQSSLDQSDGDREAPVEKIERLSGNIKIRRNIYLFSFTCFSFLFLVLLVQLSRLEAEPFYISF